MNNDDALWSEFGPLWRDLKKIADPVLVAGGYGLYLKQTWLTANRDIPIIVSVERWIDATPRVTKDLDIIIDFELIAQKEMNQNIAAALRQNGYEVINPRWQFKKSLSSNRDVIVDIHSTLPERTQETLSLDRIRVKHKPSLGETGVHGRQNPEAVGGVRHPFLFEAGGLSISVPNSVTWSLMKLTAMRDNWIRSGENQRTEKDRDFLREQAIKHAKDVCRITAMVTREERDHAVNVLKEIHENAAFVEARQIFSDFFAKETDPGIQIVKEAWQVEDLRLIQDSLAAWYA